MMMPRYSQRGRPTCDACAFRRVKCDGGQPCIDCHRRSIACTRLRQRRKRGPKGPRPATVDRIAKYKETLEKTISPLVTPPAATNSTCEKSANPIPPSWTYEFAPAAYHAHLEIFRLRLYTIWPVVDAQDLARRLADDAKDWQSHALAASLCAAVIAQLRLDQHPVVGIDSQAHEFAKAAQQLRKQNDYREYCSFDSLLCSFFLHIYFSNVQKLSTAAYLLRETVTTGHILRLHEPDSYETLPQREYQRRLRIFWMLFVTERTFCAQNDLVPILHPISELPTFDADVSANTNQTNGFADLAQLFIYLEAGFLRSEPPSLIKTGSQDGKVKILCIQKQLEQTSGSPGISETQYVDLNVTRHWIRTIIWQYTITHFAQSAQSREPAFSATYPAQIAKDTLTLLCNASASAIRADGYGMELKILRLANSVLDILVCLPTLKHSMAAFGCRDVLGALEKTLHTVGGGDSHFVALLKRRMMEADLPLSMPRELPPPTLSAPKPDAIYNMERLLEGPGIHEVDALCDSDVFAE